MNKLIITITILLSSYFSDAQIPQQVDSINRSVIDWNKYVASVDSLTSLKDFKKILDESITSKFFREGTFNDLYTSTKISTMAKGVE